MDTALQEIDAWLEGTEPPPLTDVRAAPVREWTPAGRVRQARPGPRRWRSRRFSGILVVALGLSWVVGASSLAMLA